jgi:hypothetical protein
VTLHDAPTPVPGPLVTATALILAGIVLYAVLFFLAAIYAARRDREDA